MMYFTGMERAIESLDFEGTVGVCEAQSHAMMGTAPKCEGVSLSKTISQSIDNDEVLINTLNDKLLMVEATLQQNTIEAFPITGSTTISVLM